MVLGMAFTGTPVVTQISDSVVRITGVSLASGATGIVGLAAHTGAAVDVALPHAFLTEHYTFLAHTVTFQDCLHASVGAAASAASFQLPSVVKSGTTVQDFRFTFANAFASATPALEIYIKLHT